MNKKTNFVMPEFDIDYIIKSGPGHVYWKNLDSVYIGCNKNYATLIGLNNTEEVCGMGEYDMPWGELLPETASHNIRADQKVIKTGKSVVTEENLGIKNADGNSIILRSEKLPLLDKNGNIVGILGVSVDITDRLEKEKLRAENDAQKIEYEQAIKKSLQSMLDEQNKFKKTVSQVAHDMGSPIAAMQIMIHTCSDLPENARDILRRASTRICDIANNLFFQYNKLNANLDSINVIQPTLVSCQVMEIIAEKKFEYKYENVEFTYQIDLDCAFICINTNASAFNRMMSNIVNNAVQAVSDVNRGLVDIKLQLVDGAKEVELVIEDNGCGISKEIQQKIMDRISVTFGKAEGKGIGLGQVRDVLDVSNGKLRIDSEIGVGTKIILTFPVVAAPDWLITEIKFNKDSIIVVLDDDPSIHGAWDNWFKHNTSEVNIKHFTEGVEATDFINSLSEDEKMRVLLLVDYELLKQRLTGLDVVYNVSVGQAILTTSHYGNKEVLNKAQSMGVKILPKILVQML